jgi:hypothetical protein
MWICNDGDGTHSLLVSSPALPIATIFLALAVLITVESLWATVLMLNDDVWHVDQSVCTSICVWVWTLGHASVGHYRCPASVIHTTKSGAKFATQCKATSDDSFFFRQQESGCDVCSGHRHKPKSLLHNEFGYSSPTTPVVRTQVCFWSAVLQGWRGVCEACEAVRSAILILRGSDTGLFGGPDPWAMPPTDVVVPVAVALALAWAMTLSCFLDVVSPTLAPVLEPVVVEAATSMLPMVLYAWTSVAGMACALGCQCEWQETPSAARVASLDAHARVGIHVQCGAAW